MFMRVVRGMQDQLNHHKDVSILSLIYTQFYYLFSNILLLCLHSSGLVFKFKLKLKFYNDIIQLFLKALILMLSNVKLSDIDCVFG